MWPLNLQACITSKEKKIGDKLLFQEFGLINHVCVWLDKNLLQKCMAFPHPSPPCHTPHSTPPSLWRGYSMQAVVHNIIINITYGFPYIYCVAWNFVRSLILPVLDFRKSFTRTDFENLDFRLLERTMLFSFKYMFPQQLLSLSETTEVNYIVPKLTTETESQPFLVSR